MITSHSRGARLIPVCLALGLFLGAAGHAHAQASLSFSGGNNTPFVLTLNGPVQYIINAALTSNAPFFVFKSVGNPLGGQTGASGSISYSVNGGASHSITAENSGAAVGNISTNDLFFFGVSSALVIGDIVTLTAGTLTTTTNVAAAPPAGGSFTTFLVDGNGVKISTNGVTVPEPTTWTLLGMGAMALLGLCRRRG